MAFSSIIDKTDSAVINIRVFDVSIAGSAGTCSRLLVTARDEVMAEIAC
jgi:hypothetical protein